MNFDNSFSGALFATKNAKLLTGMFSFDGETSLALTCNLGEAGESHELVVQKRDKKGVPTGKPIALGAFKKLSAQLGPFTGNGTVSHLVARGFLTRGRETTNVVVFKVERDNDSAFYQVKRDQREVLPLSAL